jgi:chemotaxis protein MotB
LLKKFPDNQALSKSRAVNAMQILGQGGVAPTKLDSIGYGDTKPVASNDSEAGRQKNRRVEIVVS